MVKWIEGKRPDKPNIRCKSCSGSGVLAYDTGIIGVQHKVCFFCDGKGWYRRI